MASGYQLKITIRDSHPPIWRRVIVPEHITFYDLDDIIETIFGWTHEHMFGFYFRQRDQYFEGTPIPGGEDTADECIDEWMAQGESFLYTYDFGDNWEHTVKVEKIVEYDKRYPVVLKYKGPNMIEDCGGIWGFEQYKAQAQAFDMEVVNSEFMGRNFPVVVSEKKTVRDKIYDITGNHKWEDKLSGYFKTFQDQEDKIREYMGDIPSLTMVFSQYTKDNLKELAQCHGFTRYNRFKKKELAEWLKNHLLETRYMKEFLMKADEEELVLFEQAMEEKGICMSEELVGHSLLLISYGAYSDTGDFYRVPLDVQEKYKKIMTPEFRKMLEDKNNFKTWCDAVIYLYGVIPFSEFARIYNHYEGTSLTADDIKEKITEFICEEEAFVVEDEYFMDEMLKEQAMYQHVLKKQEGLDYYLPGDREQFLEYGEYECQQPDEETRFFLNYLEKTEHMEYPQALMVFHQIQEGIRMNVEEIELLEALDSWGCDIDSHKKMKRVQNLLIRFSGYIRKWDNKGYTDNEIQRGWRREEEVLKEEHKIIPFTAAKKVYPNDLCPCGSGKKYKHCCGRNK